MLLGQRKKSRLAGLTPQLGFSTVELVVTVAVLMILAAISIPTLTHAFLTYQYNAAAAQVAGMLKFTRHEAIRLNKPVSCVVEQNAAGWLVFADSNGNGNGNPDASESQYVMTGTPSLVPAGGLPDTSPITNQLGASGLVLSAPSGVNTSLTFDQRGAVTTGPNVYALYIGNTASPELGYRAVVLLPSGVVHVWTAAQNGPWQQVN
jgi:type II secretory pathway pseudopilin PulG